MSVFTEFITATLCMNEFDLEHYHFFKLNNRASCISLFSPLLIISDFNQRFIHLTSSYCQNRKDYYGILGLTKAASPKEIKKAYYQLAKKYHPDTNKDDTGSKNKFQDVSEAYEVSFSFLFIFTIELNA